MGRSWMSPARPTCPGSGMAAQLSSATSATSTRTTFPDLVFFGSNGETMLALSDGWGRSGSEPASLSSSEVHGGQLLDYDNNDGLLDLLGWCERGGCRASLRPLAVGWMDADEPGDGIGVEPSLRAESARQVSRRRS